MWHVVCIARKDQQEESQHRTDAPGAKTSTAHQHETQVRVSLEFTRRWLLMRAAVCFYRLSPAVCVFVFVLYVEEEKEGLMYIHVYMNMPADLITRISPIAAV